VCKFQKTLPSISLHQLAIGLHILELGVKYPKQDILGISSSRTGDKIKSQDEIRTEEKQERIKLVFSPKLVLTGVSPLVLDLHKPSLLPTFFIKLSFVEI